jgi:hypothetical protein
VIITKYGSDPSQSATASTGVWLDERRGYEGQMRTVTYRDGVYRVESGPEDEFWAVADPPDGEDDKL